MTTATCESSNELHSTKCVVCIRRGGVDVVDELADEWRSLCARSEDDQPFYRPEWIRANLRAFMPKAKVAIVTARIGGRLCLVLALVEDRGWFNGVPVRRLRSFVGLHGVRSDAVRSPGPDGDAAISAICEFFQELRGWDMLEFRDTPTGSTINRLIAEAADRGFRTAQVPARPNPYISVPADPELLKHTPLNSKLRSQLRQIRRRVAEQGHLKLYRLDTADHEALNRFFELEASGWKGREGSAIGCDARTRQFYHEIAESAASFGYLSLYMLELNGQLLAAHFALTHRNKCYSPKIAYSENFGQFAPGHLIISEILQDCSKRGIQGYDITGPNDCWKMKWTGETRPVNHYYVFTGLAGKLAYTMTTRVRPSVAKALRVVRSVQQTRESKTSSIGSVGYPPTADVSAQK